MIRGYVVNKLEVNAKSSIGHNPTNVIATTRVEAEEPHPSLSCSVATTSEPANGETYALGETIECEITVENVGNLTIYDISLRANDLGDITSFLDKTTLSPGEYATATFDHYVTEQDILAGSVIFEATADGDNDSDEPTDPGTGDTEDETDDLDTTLYVNIRVHNTPENDNEWVLGETIEYDITVENEGNVTFNDIHVNDVNYNLGFSQLIPSLSPGSQEEYTAGHRVDEIDILNGEVTAEITAIGDEIPDPKDPDNPKTPEGEDACTTGDEDDPDGEVPPIVEKSAVLVVTVDITSTPQNPSGYQLGELIDGKVTVTNDGNVTISDFDTICDLSGDQWHLESLAPGQYVEYFFDDYEVTPEDVQNGEITFEAVISGGEDPYGDTVIYIPGTANTEVIQ